MSGEKKEEFVWSTTRLVGRITTSSPIRVPPSCKNSFPFHPLCRFPLAFHYVSFYKSWIKLLIFILNPKRKGLPAPGFYLRMNIIRFFPNLRFFYSVYVFIVIARRKTWRKRTVFFSFVLSVRLPTHIKTASPGGILRPKIQTQAIHPHASQSYGGNETHFFFNTHRNGRFWNSHFDKTGGEKNYNLNLKQNNTGNNKKAEGSGAEVVLFCYQEIIMRNLAWNIITFGVTMTIYEYSRRVNTRHFERQNPVEQKTPWSVTVLRTFKKVE